MALHDRIRALVDQYFGGSVNAAAKTWRVPQPSVQRIYAGTTAKPRPATLDKIARAHSTTVEWLQTGKGGRDPIASPVPIVISSPEFDRWHAVIGRLGLRTADFEALSTLPGTVWDAGEHLLEAIDGRNLSPAKKRRIGAAWTRAEHQSLAAWSELFEALVEVFGTEPVRRAVIDARLRIRLGFTLLGDRLLRGADTREAIKHAVAEHDEPLAEIDKLLRAARATKSEAERERLVREATVRRIEMNRLPPPTEK